VLSSAIVLQPGSRTQELPFAYVCRFLPVRSSPRQEATGPAQRASSPQTEQTIDSARPVGAPIGARIRKREAIFVELFLTVRKALAEGLIYDLGIIKKASADQVVSDESGRPVSIRPGQWQAAAWRADRRFPELWGRKDTVVMSDVSQRELDVEIERELERLVDARQAEAAGEPAPEDCGDPPVATSPGPADDRLPDAG
jgi:hypothetical protein